MEEIQMNKISYITEKLYNMYRTRNPYLLIERMGGNIIIKDLPNSLLGQSTYYDNGYFIVSISSSIENSIMATFIAFHELGHIVLHNSSNNFFMRKNIYYTYDRYENQADEFALNIMFSNEELQEILNYDFYHTANILMIKPYIIEKVIKERLGVCLL